MITQILIPFRRAPPPQSKVPVKQQPWKLSKTISGPNFFDAWNFIERWDNTTHAATYYVNKKTAQNLGLAYIDSKSRAVIAVDSKTDLSNNTMPSVFINTTDGTFQVNPLGLRKSVRLESRERFDSGSLIIADFHHTPYGCASWGAFWMYGDNWPNNGEIDIYEGFNDQVRNRATIHTTANCSHDARAIQTGKVLQETCDFSVNYNAGCGVEDPSLDTYGARFNALGGGVYAAVYSDAAISVWSWPRHKIPEEVNSKTPDPSKWGTPTATWLNGASCQLAPKFGLQNLVLNIATCGDADRETYKQTKCPGSTCFDHLLTGSNYKEVYFSVNSIKIFKGSPTYSHLDVNTETY